MGILSENTLNIQYKNFVRKYTEYIYIYIYIYIHTHTHTQYNLDIRELSGPVMFLISGFVLFCYININLGPEKTILYPDLLYSGYTVVKGDLSTEAWSPLCRLITKANRVKESLTLRFPEIICLTLSGNVM